MDGMYKPLIEEDSNSNPAIIQSGKNTWFLFLNIFDSVLMYAKYMYEEFISNCLTAKPYL